MASVDIQESFRPRADKLGVSLLLLHFSVGFYVLAGWIVSSAAGLVFYLLLLPMIAAQWWFNRGSCILNNLESRLRFGRWRHPSNREEGKFLLMLSDWLLRTKPEPAFLDRLSYFVVALLWIVGFSHLTEIMLNVP